MKMISWKVNGAMKCEEWWRERRMKIWHLWAPTYLTTELVAYLHATMHGSSQEILASEFRLWVMIMNVSMMGFTWVTTMNIKNVGSCVNNIQFIICSLAVMIIIYPYSYWKIYAINVLKETSLSIIKPLCIFLNPVNMYSNDYEAKCNRVSLEKKML